jgi:membrane-bound inhibitor of C-type lysozyme
MRASALPTLVLLAALAACKPQTPPAAAAPPAPAAAPAAVNPGSGVRTYHCADGTAVQAGYPSADTAVVRVGGRDYTLEIAVSASGARYVGYGLQWWTKGPEARLSRLKPNEDVASDPGVVCRIEPGS